MYIARAIPGIEGQPPRVASLLVDTALCSQRELRLEVKRPDGETAVMYLDSAAVLALSDHLIQMVIANNLASRATYTIER
jgi:hypothetical protein